MFGSKEILVKNDYTKLHIQLYVVILSIYYFLNILFPTDYSEFSDNSNRIYPQIVAVILAIYSYIISFKYILTIKRSKILILFVAFFLLACLYIVYPMDIIYNIKYVTQKYMGIIVLYTGYILQLRAKQDDYWEKHLNIIFYIQLIYALFSLLYDRFIFINTSEELFDSNAGFILTACIPLTLIIKPIRLRSYVLLFIVMACIYSGQRSAALTAILCAPFAFASIKRSIKKSDIIVLLTFLIIIGFPILFKSFENLHARNLYDVGRDDFGSGRLIIWGIVISDYINSDFLHIIFGNGLCSVEKLLGEKYGISIGAHNGWLDCIYTFGASGFIIYAAIQLSLLARAIRLRKSMKQYSTIYFVLFILFFVKSITSHGYFDITMIPYMLVIAYIEASIIKHET